MAVTISLPAPGNNPESFKGVGLELLVLLIPPSQMLELQVFTTVPGC